MKIVIATPLYPPDVDRTAVYVKELARRLLSRHEVTIVAYAYLPEQVPNVRIVAIDKRRPLFERLFFFFLALRQAALASDVLIAENGRSVELPTGLVAWLTKTPLIMHTGDSVANQEADRHLWLRIIRNFATHAACTTVTSLPLSRPELLPFAPQPTVELAAYEASWCNHLAEVEQLITHVRI